MTHRTHLMMTICFSLHHLDHTSEFNLIFLAESIHNFTLQFPQGVYVKLGYNFPTEKLCKPWPEVAPTTGVCYNSLL